MIRASQKLVSLIAATGLLSIAIPTMTLAEDLTEFSAPATGADMWTGMMGRAGLYTPHPNDCSAGEAFIGVATSRDGVTLGFCIEENERESTASWVDARHTCLADNKRLPEPGEFHFACVNGTGLNDMTDNWEWSSSFSSNATVDDLTPRQGVGAPIMGNGSCTTATVGWIANSDDTPNTLAFRCVR